MRHQLPFPKQLLCQIHPHLTKLSIILISREIRPKSLEKLAQICTHRGHAVLYILSREFGSCNISIVRGGGSATQRLFADLRRVLDSNGFPCVTKFVVSELPDLSSTVNGVVVEDFVCTSALDELEIAGRAGRDDFVSS